MKKLFFFALLFTCALWAYSDDGTNKTSVPINPIHINIPERPHSPSNQEITCTYSEGCLLFNFRYPEGMCTLEVTDSETGDILTYSFDSEGEAVVLVGELNNAHLLITTTSGHSYEGYLQ